jgi:hypothetical protein
MGMVKSQVGFTELKSTATAKEKVLGRLHSRGEILE